MTDSPPTTDPHHVTNIRTDVEATRAFYEEVLGFHTVKMTEDYDDPGTLHYYFSSTPEGEPGTTIGYFEYLDVDYIVLDKTGTITVGEPGPDASHHFALGVEDGDALEEWRDYLGERDVRVSSVRDRTYFESVYFGEPDGLTIELVTTGPGFSVDEDEPGREFVDPPADPR